MPHHIVNNVVVRFICRLTDGYHIDPLNVGYIEISAGPFIRNQPYGDPLMGDRRNLNYHITNDISDGTLFTSPNLDFHMKLLCRMRKLTSTI